MTISRNFSLLITLMIPLVFLSCDNDDEPEGVRLYEGSWSGTYVGSGDNGTWRVEIDDQGNISGTATSFVLSMNFGLSGTVNSEGEFHATTGSASSGTTFTGTLTATDGQGTWENSQTGLSGSWSGYKEEDEGVGGSNNPI